MGILKNIFGNPNEEMANQPIGWKPLVTMSQLDEIADHSFRQAILIFKHSTRCGISRMVLKRFESDFDAPDIIPYFLDLLQYRDISNEIAGRFDVQHQSPQIIVIKDGKVIYNASHESIDAEKLNDLI